MSRLRLLIITLCVAQCFLLVISGKAESGKIPLGVILDQSTDDVKKALEFAVHLRVPKDSPVEFEAFVDTINTADAYKLSRIICSQFDRKVVAMMGAVSPDSFDTLHSYSNTFQMPFLTPWFPEKVLPPSSGMIDFAVSLIPDYHRAVIDTIKHYGWKTIIYMYDSNDGLLRLQQLYQYLQPGNATFRISTVKRVNSASDVIKFLKAIEKIDRWSNKYVVLDSTAALAKEALLAHVRDAQLGRRNYHYFLSGLVMDEYWDQDISELGAINVTGFRLLDYSRQLVVNFMSVWYGGSISARAALMYDGVSVLRDAVQRILKRKPDLFNPVRNAKVNVSRGDCNPKFDSKMINYGEKISKALKKTEISGLSGTISFNEFGHRKNFSLQVVELTVFGTMQLLAVWNDNKGFVTLKKKKVVKNGGAIVINRNKTYIISSIEEAPYMIRTFPDDTEQSQLYIGFCAELAAMVAEKLEIKYEFRIVKDGKYGTDNPRVGGWDGMVGELLRKEVDIIIAPLTVTLEREAVIDFTKPFLSFDEKSGANTIKDSSSVFSFLRPLSIELWLCVTLSILAVSFVLFLVSKYSRRQLTPALENNEPSTSDAAISNNQANVVNEFSFWNSMWFSVSSFMQQGNAITPRSLPGRILSCVWWFFVLIIVCSYTANLASYLTLSRLSEPLTSYNRIYACPEDSSYVDQARGGMNVDTSWWSFLFQYNTKKNYHCKMVIAASAPGVKDFAIAVPKNSKLREALNFALQCLKNDGDMQNLIQKWFIHSECDLNGQNIPTFQLSLGQVAGLFYVLLGGMALSITVALIENCRARRKPASVDIPLRSTTNGRRRRATRGERRNTAQRTPQREQDRLGWNTGAFNGYYSPTTQIGEEETALHSSFTQV